jgi:hypothetical protein
LAVGVYQFPILNQHLVFPLGFWRWRNSGVGKREGTYS